MKKHEFLSLLQDRLSCLPRKEREERLAFYNEIIDDRMEEGLSEEEAVAQIGDVEEIAAQIIDETPVSRRKNETGAPKKRYSGWQIVLLALGSPLWLSLLIAAFAVVVALYGALWAVVISLWAVFASVVACFPAGIFAGILNIGTGNPAGGTVLIAAGLVCAGLSIYLFYGCRAVTGGAVWLTGQLPRFFKRCFNKKEDT